MYGGGGGSVAVPGAGTATTEPPATAAAVASSSRSGLVAGLEGLVAAARGSASASASSLSSGSPAPAGAARPRRMTGGRMLLFLATEKDCVDDAGAEAECVICLEEFEVGHEMGRLECLCKFHRVRSFPWLLALLIEAEMHTRVVAYEGHRHLSDAPAARLERIDADGRGRPLLGVSPVICLGQLCRRSRRGRKRVTLACRSSRPYGRSNS
jgi:hypothetical protein